MKLQNVGGRMDARWTAEISELENGRLNVKIVSETGNLICEDIIFKDQLWSHLEGREDW